MSAIRFVRALALLVYSARISVLHVANISMPKDIGSPVAYAFDARTRKRISTTEANQMHSRIVIVMCMCSRRRNCSHMSIEYVLRW